VREDVQRGKFPAGIIDSSLKAFVIGGFNEARAVPALCPGKIREFNFAKLVAVWKIGQPREGRLESHEAQRFADCGDEEGLPVNDRLRVLEMDWRPPGWQALHSPACGGGFAGKRY
jgi:hypothetical protein